MDGQQQVVIRGRYEGGAFIPDGPAPAVEGPAELIVMPVTYGTDPRSVFELFGKAPRLRTKEDIDAQIKEERDSWGEP